MIRTRLRNLTVRTARRVVAGVVGTTLLAVGLILVFTPGPAFVVLWMGLGVLAVEFAWARRWLRRLKRAATDAAQLITGPNAALPVEPGGSEPGDSTSDGTRPS